jgi:hypothetical protein
MAIGRRGFLSTIGAGAVGATVAEAASAAPQATKADAGSLVDLTLTINGQRRHLAAGTRPECTSSKHWSRALRSRASPEPPSTRFAPGSCRSQRICCDCARRGSGTVASAPRASALASAAPAPTRTYTAWARPSPSRSPGRPTARSQPESRRLHAGSSTPPGRPTSPIDAGGVISWRHFATEPRSVVQRRRCSASRTRLAQPLR